MTTDRTTPTDPPDARLPRANTIDAGPYTMTRRIAPAAGTDATSAALVDAFVDGADPRATALAPETVAALRELHRANSDEPPAPGAHA